MSLPFLDRLEAVQQALVKAKAAGRPIAPETHEVLGAYVTGEIGDDEMVGRILDLVSDPPLPD